MTGDQSVGVALLGAGIWARDALLPSLASSVDVLRLEAVWSRSENSVESLLEKVQR